MQEVVKIMCNHSLSISRWKRIELKFQPSALKLAQGLWSQKWELVHCVGILQTRVEDHLSRITFSRSELKTGQSLKSVSWLENWSLRIALSFIRSIHQGMNKGVTYGHSLKMVETDWQSFSKLWLSCAGMGLNHWMILRRGLHSF